MKRGRDAEEIKQLEMEIVMFTIDLESMKKHKQEAIDERKKRLQELRGNLVENRPLYLCESKDEVEQIIKAHGTEKVRLTEDGRYLCDFIDRKIDDNDGIVDGNCAIYYKLRSNPPITKIICYDYDDKNNEWETKMEKLDKDEDWVQIFAK
jgi:hypothetical protein